MKYLFFVCGFAFAIQSCNLDTCINKSYFVTTYNNFIKDMDKNHDRYSSEDWKSKDAKMKNFVDDCYAAHSEDMTGKEKIDFWTKYIQYMITRHGSSAWSSIENEDKNSDVEIFDEISDSLEDADLKKLFKDVYGDNIEDAVDDILKEVNKWGDQLKDWLNSKN